ncbi:MAG: hypothetical protein H0T42_26975 [Deltaproteobacteria bacterium]|nr:hypothetical protein [Deltaproteobacteria bacterium]
MASIRPYLLAALSLTFVACSGDDGGTVIPEGEHYQFVSKKAYVPTNNNQAREFGLDLNGDKTVDNQLGMVLGTLSTMGFDIQATINEAVAEGSIILLVDFQTPDPTFTSSSASGLRVLLGDVPTPAACNLGETYCNTATPPVCTGCQRHLNGMGSFTVAAGSPPALGGKIINGTFTGGPGDLSLQIALGGTDGIQLDLIGARAKASGISADGMTSVILAGALTEEDLNTKVIPAISTQIAPVIAEDCNALTSPPACGCMAGSTGKTVLDLFDGGDGTAKNCAVSVEEIKQNSLIQSLLAPDVTIDGRKALSLGIKVETVKATFPAQ